MKRNEQISGITGVVLVLIALIWYSITNIWNVYHWILSGAGLGGVIYSLYIYYATREKELSSRSIKSGTNILFQVIIVLAIVGLIAFITTKNSKRFDWTKSSLYSLSDQTEKILVNLDKDVEIKAFYNKNDFRRAQDVLDEFAYRSSQIEFEMIDPQENPDITKRYNITKFNTVIVESGIKREVIEQLNESNLTNAIIKVTRDQDKVIYFLTGHGERSIHDDQREGFKAAVDAIKSENHLVREINLIRNPSVPDSCTVLAIMSPKTDLFPAEYDSIKSYLDRGGKLFLTADPDRPESLNGLLSNFGLRLRKDIVLDISAMGQIFGGGPAIPLVTQYDENHDISKGFGGVMSFFPWTCSVWPLDEKNGYTISEICKTSEESWAEVNLQDGRAGFDEGVDIQGPITLAAIAEKDAGERKTIVAVFGTSAFAANGYFKQQGNGDLFLNTINYMAEEKDMISIRPKQVEDSRLTMTEADINGMFYLVVVAIPLLVIIMGVVLYFKRNR